MSASFRPTSSTKPRPTVPQPSNPTFSFRIMTHSIQSKSRSPRPAARIPALDLQSPARNRRHQQNLIALLKRITVSSEESNILLVDVHVQEAPNLPGFIPQMRLQIRELLIKRAKQFTQV